MKSRYIVFPSKGEIEVREEAIPSPGQAEVLIKAERSLFSIGTELSCLRGEFDPGTNWEAWVKYPFRPGYSMVGRVMRVGADVTDLVEGERVTVYASRVSGIIS